MDPLTQEAETAYTLATQQQIAALADPHRLPAARASLYALMQRCITLEAQFCIVHPRADRATLRHPSWYAAKIAELLAPASGGIGWPLEADVDPASRDDHLLPEGWW